MHANFLELNFLSQIRTVPNPAFFTAIANEAQNPHPLTLHLSPTSTANVTVSQTSPSVSDSSPFVKVAPDAEVIVAPKTRPQISQDNDTKSKSIMSTGRKSAGGRIASNVSHQRSKREESNPVTFIFLRCIERQFCQEWFDDDDFSACDKGLVVWVDQEISSSKIMKGLEWVSISLVQPAALMVPLDPQQQQKAREFEASEVGKPASKVVARLLVWDDPPDASHVAISSALSSALGVNGNVGALVRIEPANGRMSSNRISSLRIYPFKPVGASESEGVRFDGVSKQSLDEVAQKIRALYSGIQGMSLDILDGPLTDGLILPKVTRQSRIDSCEGLMIRFDPPAKSDGTEDGQVRWFLGQELKVGMELRQEISNPRQTSQSPIETITSDPPILIGISAIIDRLLSHLSHSSSVLLTGGIGSGKTSVAHVLGHRLRSSYLFHVSLFRCRKLVSDETRVSAIKEMLEKLLMSASWGARFGGRSVVILDDLDKICPVETELQVGGDNSRSQQVSEVICFLVRQYCSPGSAIVLLATAQNRESVNNKIVGGHIVKEIVSLKVPGKDGRRQILQALVREDYDENRSEKELENYNGDRHPRNHENESLLLKKSISHSPPKQVTFSRKFGVGPKIDFLDLAGRTDGYMPGDLILLVSRAKSEALIRSVGLTSDSTTHSQITLTNEDFQRALQGFAPASLRNVKLESSTTTFDSIGGLRDTRKVLLETLQYPTIYAPIFAQCPLRLRSGLLLYGYPGCGKTLLASAVAGECGLNFISVKGPEILNKYIGASEKSVRDLFERAEAARPCVLFFDEFDSIAPKRGHDSTGVTDRVVNQLLTQMDGAEGLSGVYVLAATSRPDLIDPALLRPGRLDKSLLCDLPNLNDRWDILQALSKKLHISPDILESKDPHRNLLEVALRTDGYSGADLQAVIYNAHLEAIHHLLDERKTTTADRRQKTASSRKSASTLPRSNIIQFRYGAENNAGSTSPIPNNLKQITEQASLLAKFEAIRRAKRIARNAHHDDFGKASSAELRMNKAKSNNPDAEVIIQWKHLESSLRTTRSSISVEERRRLGRIYREFVGERSGEMPNGQGPTEVGGRTSLM